MRIETTHWDVQDYLSTPENCARFIEAVIDEAGDDSTFIAKALGDVARARGMTSVVYDTGLSQESFHKALSGDCSPDFATVLKMLRALGLRLHIKPLATCEAAPPTRGC